MSETVKDQTVRHIPVNDLDSGIPVRTRVYILVGDLDVSSGYPKGTCCFNTSRETTKRELCSFDTVPKEISHFEGINLSGGFTNAVYYATQMYSVPTLFAWDDHLNNEKTISQ